MTSKIDIVVTMAGAGMRFRQAGYNVPKYMIKAKGRTLFEWSLSSLESFAGIAGQYIFVAREDEKEDVQQFIEEKCEKLGIQKYQILVIGYLTEGQAATAMLASRYWNKDHGLLIYNIDTYVEEGGMSSGELRGDGFIPCFEAEGSHWSFVRTNEVGKAVEIEEKQRISGHCSVGAYYFRTCDLYEKLYRQYYGQVGSLQCGEKYIAPLYNQLLKEGGEVYISEIMPEKVHVLGTPEELDSFMKLE